VLALYGAYVHLLEVAHDHHLPFSLVLRYASKGRPSESFLSDVLVVFLRLWKNDGLEIILSFP
jgi:hypothetical protein